MSGHNSILETAPGTRVRSLYLEHPNSQTVGLAALTNGSIVAREYGIPAVMGTGDATQRIENGELVRVDGNRGTVTLVDRIDPQEEERLQAQRVAEAQASARKRKALFALAAGVLVVLAVWWKKRR